LILGRSREAPTISTNFQYRRTGPQAELIEERGQYKPADCPKSSAALKITPDQLKTPKSQWTWVTVAKKRDMALSEHTTSVAVKYGDTQLAVYHVPKRGFYATQQMYVGVSLALACS